MISDHGISAGLCSMISDHGISAGLCSAEFNYNHVQGLAQNTVLPEAFNIIIIRFGSVENQLTCRTFQIKLNKYLMKHSKVDPECFYII